MESTQSPGRVRAPGFVRTAGMLCVVGGVGWVANGLWQFALGAPSGAGFIIWEASWLAVQSLLLVGVVGLALSGAAAGLFGAVALGVALLGRVVFVASEMHSLAIGEESLLIPLAALITALGMTLVGIAVLRTRRWHGWRRLMPLLAGIYPFAAMFPFIFISNEPNNLSIALWGVPWLLLGYAIWSKPHEAATR